MLLEHSNLLLEAHAGAEVHDLRLELTAEVGGLLGADRGPADGATLRPGTLERLEALRADVAGSHPLHVLAAKDDLHLALNAAVGKPEPLRLRLTHVEGNNRPAPTLAHAKVLRARYRRCH